MLFPLSVFADNQISPSFANDASTFVPAAATVHSTNFSVSGSLEPIVGTMNSVTFVTRSGNSRDEMAVTLPTPPPPPPPPSHTGGGGGGGGGGGAAPTATGVTVSGTAYPNSLVSLLRDGAVAGQVNANPDATFTLALHSMNPGSYQFSVSAKDVYGLISSPFTFHSAIATGTVLEVSGVFLAPTITLDKTTVKKGDPIQIYGQSAPKASLTIQVTGDATHDVQANAGDDGKYTFSFDTAPLALGSYQAQSKALLANAVSQLSTLVGFSVGTTTAALPSPGSCGRRGDLNCDGKVNLVDFSIAAYWYKRTLSSDFALIEKQRLNGDGKITLVDFSIIAFYWTG